MQRLTIAPDFQALCPRLTDEELRLLEESLVEEGCQQAIVVWQCNKQIIVVDGHNRYALCTKHRLSFKLRFLKVESRQEAIGWAARNQLGRRNATEEQKSYLRGKLYGESKLSEGRPPKDGKLAQSELVSTAEKIALETGVSTATVKRDEKFAEDVDELAEKSENLKAAALRGDIPKSAVSVLADAPKSTLKKLEKLEGKELREAVRELTYTCPNCGSHERDEDGDCTKCYEPAAKPAKPAKGREKSGAAKLVDMLMSKHAGPLARGLTTIAEKNGGEGAQFKVANAALNQMLNAMKKMRGGER